MRTSFLAALAIASTLCGSGVQATDSTLARIRELRAQQVNLVEAMLKDGLSSGVHVRVIYLRRLEFGLSEPGFCGEAAVGPSERTRFLLDLNTGEMRLGLSAEEWSRLSCRSMEGTTIVGSE